LKTQKNEPKLINKYQEKRGERHVPESISFKIYGAQTGENVVTAGYGYLPFG
jgi:hypothetical protein